MFIRMELTHLSAPAHANRDVAGSVWVAVAVLLILAPFWVPAIAQKSLAVPIVNMGRHDQAGLTNKTAAVPIESPAQIYFPAQYVNQATDIEPYVEPF